VRIVFNLKYFRAGGIGGQESVIRQLAAGLARFPLDPRQQMFAFCPPGERAAVESMCSWAGFESVAIDESDRNMARALRRLRPDLYLCPMLVVEPPDPPCPTVISVPDLQHETYPELFSPEVLANRRRTYGYAVGYADMILTISDYARGTILERFPDIDPARVVVSRPGLEPAFEAALAAAAPARALNLPQDYLLYPANFWMHKNHVRLLEAIARLRHQGVRPFLALTGDPGSGFERVTGEIERLGLSEQVRFLGRLPTAEFVAAMRGARAVVFPSLYEGFGLPILEAFHCDTPVLCSNVTSCPEVAGDAALLLDPASTDSIAARLARIWSDPDLRTALVGKGRRRRAELAENRSFETIRAALTYALRHPKPRPGPLRRFFARARPASLEP
jgi:glycosyltransferase involved in cell wall biosynthesis